MATLGWGLLSTARINRRLIPAIRAAKRAELRAVASRSQVRAQAYAAEWNIPQAHGSYEALLADPDIDVIYVSQPGLPTRSTRRAGCWAGSCIPRRPLGLPAWPGSCQMPWGYPILQHTCRRFPGNGWRPPPVHCARMHAAV